MRNKMNWTATVAGILLTAAMVLLGACMVRGEEVTSTDATATIEASTTPIVVPQKTLDRNARWVVIIDEPAQHVSVRWRRGYVDAEGKFIGERTCTYQFRDETSTDKDGQEVVVRDGWSTLRKGVKVTLKKPLAIVTPEGVAQTLPEGTKVKITEKMMIRAIVKALRQSGEL